MPKGRKSECTVEARNKLYSFRTSHFPKLPSYKPRHGDRLRSLISSLQHTHKVCYKERHNEVDYGSTMLAIATEDLQAAT